MVHCPFLHSAGGLDLPVLCYWRVQRRLRFSDFLFLPPTSLILKGIEKLVNSSFKVMNSESMATCIHLLKWHGGGHLQIAGTQSNSCLLVETQRKLSVMDCYRKNTSYRLNKRWKGGNYIHSYDYRDRKKKWDLVTWEDGGSVLNGEEKNMVRITKQNLKTELQKPKSKNSRLASWKVVFEMDWGGAKRKQEGSHLFLFFYLLILQDLSYLSSISVFYLRFPVVLLGCSWCMSYCDILFFFPLLKCLLSYYENRFVCLVSFGNNQT